MVKFGQLKTNIDALLAESYRNKNFKTTLLEFKKKALSNKAFAETYLLYNKLSNKQGLSESIVDEYMGEVIDKISTNIKDMESILDDLDGWTTTLTEEYKNEYVDIDEIVYNKNINNLEKVLEAKHRIRGVLIENNNTQKPETPKMPLSMMKKVVLQTLNRKYGDISESEKKELQEILSIKGNDLISEITILKETITSKLNNILDNESDEETITKLKETIKRVENEKVGYLSLYKLRNLNNGIQQQ